MKTAIVLIALLLVATPLYPQAGVVSAIDGLTPEALQPGSPAGSYVLSELDTLNLYNGSAHVEIPLLQIGGRGEAGYTMYAKYDTHWDGLGFFNDFTCSSVPCWVFDSSGWANWDYSYRPAGLAVRHLGQGSYSVLNNGTVSCTLYASTLTRVAIGLADGTEVMLVDAGTSGRPQQTLTSSCSPQGFDRGTVFVSTDGSAMTFIADGRVYDSTTGGPVSGDAITGTLYFRDGRSFHFGRYT